MHRTTPRALVAAATLLAALAAGASPALAGEGHQRDADVVTEDTDANDGNTPDDVADDGDDAHPSGRDRSVERGGSATQGHAQADPDDDGRGPDRSNGGLDQAGGPGGVDLADQDGNNGCGNDDDFEDDNEGWCGRPPHSMKDSEVAPAENETEVEADDDERDVRVESQDDEEQGEVEVGAQGGRDAVLAVNGSPRAVEGVDVAPADVEVMDASAEVLALETEVLAAGATAPVAIPAATVGAAGTSVIASTAGAAAGVLAFTGIGVVPMLVVALLLVATGLVLRWSVPAPVRAS